MTPVLSAQWDDPDSITEQQRWIANWRLRAIGKGIEARNNDDPDAARDAHYQFTIADARLREFDARWTSGGSSVVRDLRDRGVIEVLGGPMTHTFTPHLLEPIADAALEAGLRDHTVRFGQRPTAMWAPECAYTPGLESIYARHGIGHVMVDGPTILGAGHSAHRPHRIGSTDVVAFGRDLDLTYRVWSPRRGYPGSEWYQDFHAFDHAWGLRAFRVTRRNSAMKAPYDPQRAAAQVLRDAEDFVDNARRIMLGSSEPDPLVVVAYDTELFGHWWHEGPAFLSAVFDAVDAAGIELTTLSAAREQALPHPGVHLAPGSWGSGKDYRVWEDGEAGDLRDRGTAAQYAVLEYLRRLPDTWRASRHATADAIVTELLLALSSDWAFMVTKDSAADYARGRADTHLRRVSDLLRSVHHDPHLHVHDNRLPFVDARLVQI